MKERKPWILRRTYVPSHFLRVHDACAVIHRRGATDQNIRARGDFGSYIAPRHFDSARSNSIPSLGGDGSVKQHEALRDLT